VSNVVQCQYQGHQITLQSDGWFNATQAAAKYGKAPADWFRLPSSVEYIAALKRHNPSMGKSHKSKSGPVANGGGTWLHPKLAVAFARWLDADFAVWCDAQIDALVRGKDDWRKLRHAAAASSKVQAAMLQQVREAVGKATQAHHHMNEHKLVNSLLSGEYRALPRDTLTPYQLDLLALLELRNAVLIGTGMPYEQRKGALKVAALDFAQLHQPALASAGRGELA
jgi:hypothetical protein